jgi:hypothetical protein
MTTISLIHLNHHLIAPQTQHQPLALGEQMHDKDVNGSAPVDLYFGPEAPVGRETRWIKTVPRTLARKSGALATRCARSLRGEGSLLSLIAIRRAIG